MNDKVFGTERGFAVKTLFISSLAKETRGDHLYDHFSTIGSVYSVRIHTHESTSFGFVTFKEAESAAKALKIKLHTVAGQKIAVEIAHNCHQDEPLINEDLPIELTNATGTQLLDLNDDCLQEILSNVGIMDLCSLTETSIRLKAMANEAVSRKHQICHLMEFEEYDDAKRLLCKFGSIILELSYHGFIEYDEDDVDRFPQRVKMIDVITRYCNYGALKTFNIIGGSLEECFAHSIAFKALFRKLEKIRITNDSNFQDKDCFANCEVVDLFIMRSDSDLNVILQNTFTNLQHFHCSNDWRYTQCFNIKKFLVRHKNLKSITLISGGDHSSTLPTIAGNCKNLEKLQISTNCYQNPRKYAKYVKSISTLHNLKEILIYADPNATKLIEALESLQSLQQLELAEVRFGSDFLPALLRLKNVTILRLYDCYEIDNLNSLCKMHQLKELLIQSRAVLKDKSEYDSDDDSKDDRTITFDLVHMIKSLTNLRKLSLKLDFRLDEETYFRIVDIVRKRHGQHSLEIKCQSKSQCYRNYCHLVKLRHFQYKREHWRTPWENLKFAQLTFL